LSDTHYYYSTYNYYDTAGQASPTTYPGASYSPSVFTPDPCPGTMADAWEDLAADRCDAALEAFNCLAQVLPDDGLPLIGSALAASLLDQQEDAIAAMREALRIDPEALGYAPDDERLHSQVAQLVEQYEYRARTQFGDLDALFMVAALLYLLGQEDTAYYAIDIAVNLGDIDASTSSLKALMEAPAD
jgi:tetratricopeptide (TPR) repeat protein